MNFTMSSKADSFAPTVTTRDFRYSFRLEYTEDPLDGTFIRSESFFSSMKLLRLLPMKSPSEGSWGERASEGETMSSGCSAGKTKGAFVGDMLSVGEMADGILNDGQFGRCQ